VELKEQLEELISPLVAKVSKLEAAVEQLDRKFEANNLILHGIPTLTIETTESLVNYLEGLWKKLGVGHTITLDDTYRLGRPHSSGTRPVMVKLLRAIDKKQILTKRKDAAKIKIFINEDCTALEQFQKKLLNTHLKAMKEMDGTRWGSIRGNSLHVKKPGHLTRKFAVKDGCVKELHP
jgi:hypothetical protein